MSNEQPKGGAHAAGAKKKKLGLPAIILLVITGVLVVVVAVVGVAIFNKYNNIQQQQSELDLLYPTADPADMYVAAEDEDWDVTVESEPINEELGILQSFEELHKINDDVIGFVRIPGTQLSTPVVQGTDNTYYLDHDYYKKNALGIPFADYRAKITREQLSHNITIYGHSARDGSYFASLKNFNSLDYYKQHPVVTFDTIYGKGTYKIVGAFIAKVTTKAGEAADPEWFNYHEYIDMSSTQFDTFVQEMNKRSYFNTGVDMMYGDQLVTLSTCDTEIIPSGDTPYRMVVVARRVRAGENAAVDTSKATANTEMIMPQAWQDKYGKANPYK